ncbi:hypothetical protein AWB69_00572 [Caballeronia udeis]|uniref:Glycosyltransferase RgtA/B/C/D-like domain-containing protein n=1 Tax=Caballeronia udeis TaxID=1232866 RepID=A0A158F2L9_9BURK|nr:hypothetical protein [Caballeronia udeis]SAL14056.1 hypothetical protein AWB69_00572 [Caballeronia udeis]
MKNKNESFSNTKPALQKSHIFLICLAIVVFAVLLLTKRQELTGDEPRYLMYSASFLHSGHFVMSLPDFQKLYFDATGHTADALPMGAGGVVLLNGVYLPAILSPIGLMFSLAGLRFVTLIAGLIGLYYLYKLCQRLSDSAAPKLAVTIAALSIPLLPYLHLFYMETFVFALVCVTWERLQTIDRSVRADAVTAVLILLIPFVHMRGSVVTVALYAIFLWQIYQRGLRARAVCLAVLAVGAAALLVVLNIEIYGAITGPVNSARPPLPTEWFSVIAMQLFNVRHGLFAYAPIWLLGYAGIWIGVMRKSKIGVQALVLAIIAALTGVGVNPGECWPARFWVMSMPMLTVGLCIWWPVSKHFLLRLIALALIAVTLANTVLFITRPNIFLENRQSTVSYQWMFDRVGKVNVGVALPVELPDEQNTDAARNLALGAGAVMLLMIAAAMRRQWLYAVLAVVLLLIAADLTRMSALKSDEYTATAEPSRLSVALHVPVKSVYVQIGQPWMTWVAPPSVPMFTVRASGTGVAGEHSMYANQVIPVSCHLPVQNIVVDTTAGVDFAKEAGFALKVYRSDSWTRRLYEKFSSGC